jgi:hypothetical protein
MKTSALTKKEILSKVSERKLIEHYIGIELKHGLKISAPYREDKKPSLEFSYFEKLKRWYFRDWGIDSKSHDCFELIRRLIQAETIEPALLRIYSDFNKGLFKKPYADKLKSKYESTNKDFTIKYRSFQEWDLNYWRRYGIAKGILDKYNVKSVKEYSFVDKSGRRRYFLTRFENLVFAYSEENFVKIYKPEKKEYRFIHLGERPKGFVFGYEQLPSKSQVLYITGGEKDVLTMASIGLNAITLNSETAQMPKDLAIELMGRFAEIVVLYDNDSTGIQFSQKLVDEFGFLQIILPTEV